MSSQPSHGLVGLRVQPFEKSKQTSGLGSLAAEAFYGRQNQARFQFARRQPVCQRSNQPLFIFHDDYLFLNSDECSPLESFARPSVLAKVELLSCAG